MTTTDYEQITSALAATARVIDSNRGEFSAADLRLRSLIAIATKEVKRAMLEASCELPSGHRADAGANGAGSFPSADLPH